MPSSTARPRSSSTLGPADEWQQVLAAAAQCIAQGGVEQVSMDDIAAASGISRATLYRRYGSREAIFTALLQQQAQPFVAEVMRLSARASSLAERLELSTLHAVQQSTSHPALRQLFGQGVSVNSLQLVRPVYRELVTASLVPALEQARQAGELREGLDIDTVVDWLLSNFLMLVAAAPWEPEALRLQIRQFLLPVLIPDATRPLPSPTPALPAEPATLASLDRRLSELQHSMSLLHLELAQLRRL